MGSVFFIGRKTEAAEGWMQVSVRQCPLVALWGSVVPCADGHTRPPDLPLEKPVYRSGSNRTGRGTTNWFQIGTGVRQGYILSPCLFNLYAEYIMRNAGLEEAQAGIKIVGRNINNLRHANDTMQNVKKN